MDTYEESAIMVIDVLSCRVMSSTIVWLGLYAWEVKFSMTGAGLGIVGSTRNLEYGSQKAFGFIFLYDFPNMHRVCSLKPCENWHEAASACTLPLAARCFLFHFPYVFMRATRAGSSL